MYSIRHFLVHQLCFAYCRRDVYFLDRLQLHYSAGRSRGEVPSREPVESSDGELDAEALLQSSVVRAASASRFLIDTAVHSCMTLSRGFERCSWCCRFGGRCWAFVRACWEALRVLQPSATSVPARGLRGHVRGARGGVRRGARVAGEPGRGARRRRVRGRGAGSMVRRRRQ